MKSDGNPSNIRPWIRSKKLLLPGSPRFLAAIYQSPFVWEDFDDDMESKNSNHFKLIYIKSQIVANSGLCYDRIIMLKKELQPEIFTRSVEDVITREELKTLLGSGKQIRIKLGIDATSPDLHIGHAVPLWKIRALQEQGHKAVIVLGDFTTQIGDPTGRSKTRPVLAPDEIKKNTQSIRRQVGKILLTSPKLLEFRKNSEWHGKMKSADFLKLLSLVTHARLIERDMFQRRMKDGQEIFMHEMLYPVLQGYDSVAINSDTTIIGSDQLFNEHMGRFFQERFGQHPQVIVTLKLLPGLDGREKMSKSLGNYIGLEDSPEDKFGRAMRITDSLILPYLEAYTDVSLNTISVWKQKIDRGENPMKAKLFFANALVRRYHGGKIAERVEKQFLLIFSKKEAPTAAPSIKVRHGAWNLAELLVAGGLAVSKSEARRLIEQRAVEIDGNVMASSNQSVDIKKGTVVRVGKHRFVRVG